MIHKAGSSHPFAKAAVWYHFLIFNIVWLGTFLNAQISLSLLTVL